MVTNAGALKVTLFPMRDSWQLYDRMDVKFRLPFIPNAHNIPEKRAASTSGNIRLPLLANRHRFLWRLRAPISPDETRRVERWLASARVFLAISALVAIWLDPSALSTNSAVPYWLLRIYIAHSVVVMLLVRWRRESTPAFRLLVHAADVIWPAIISIYGAGQPSPFFLFFVFVLLAAAYRWGLWETLGTAIAAVALLWGEAFILEEVFHPTGTVLAEFLPKRLFMRSISLMITGLFLGYLAEQQKQLRAEKAVIAHILGKARVELGTSGTLHGILHELLSTFGAQCAVMASQEANSFRIFVGEVAVSGGTVTPLKWLNPATSDRNLYLADSPADAFYASHNGGSFQLIGLDPDGVRERSLSSEFVDRLGTRHKFQAVVSVSFTLGREWWGRIFLFDPLLTGDRLEELRFLQELIRQVSPAVYNVFLLRRLRLRAGAVERARVARELHDGAVQSLISMEMQVDVLRRQSAGESPRISGELGRIQGLLREEILKLRELMQEMKSIDVDARKLPSFVNDTVERFQRETGISARFVFDLEPTGMPARTCRELTRIVQEALVNVRKHSKARQVMVRLSSDHNHWKLTIEDDGRGFDFTGRLSQVQLDEVRKGPVVIKERVRLIDGELTIESNPGRGSRLEITVPQEQEAAHG
ncbi:MAG TPA: histidine kinase [Terriglobales bacterium]|nr:histidine kinase [Terriglobales bacterium]